MAYRTSCTAPRKLPHPSGIATKGSRPSKP
uniref:Uncharacterized protein n=1 Tax=Arundo donax TaxID=35708 RepID=A0A0A9DJ83_ARUDO